MLEGSKKKPYLSQQHADRGVRSAGQALRELRAGLLLAGPPLDLRPMERRAPEGCPVVQNTIGIAYQVGKANP